MSAPIQLPPYWRETPASEFRAQAAPYHVADPDFPRHWEHTGGGEGVLVGVADTGVDADHREIRDRVANGASFVRKKTYADGNGHGTHVATIIGGASVGVAPNVRLACAKVLDDNGSGDSQAVAGGIDWLVSVGCQIINLSLGGTDDDPYTRGAVLRAIDAGVLVFAATGNERAKRVGFPAQHCTAIGAVDRRFRLADFSNRGKDVDAVGYGVNILAGVPGNQYQAMSGTSMATPFIAGVAANRLSAELKHAGKRLTRSTADMLRLEAFTKDLGPDGLDTSYGRGFPDFDRLFYELLEPTPAAPTQPVDGMMLCRVEEVGTGRLFVGNLYPQKTE